jgi:hypothetical protein
MNPALALQVEDLLAIEAERVISHLICGLAHGPAAAQEDGRSILQGVFVQPPIYRLPDKMAVLEFLRLMTQEAFSDRHNWFLQPADLTN